MGRLRCATGKSFHVRRPIGTILFVIFAQLQKSLEVLGLGALHQIIMDLLKLNINYSRELTGVHP